MDSHLRSQVVFHLTGRRTESDALESGVSGLRPALLAAYRDLDALRYDFPLVLCGGEDYVQSLSAAVDRVLRKLAPEGVTGEGMRRRVLKVEREIRRQVTAGASGTLLQLWDKASDTLATQADDEFGHDVRRARGALGIDGDVARTRLGGLDALQAFEFQHLVDAAFERSAIRPFHHQHIGGRFQGARIDTAHADATHKSGIVE